MIAKTFPALFAALAIAWALPGCAVPEQGAALPAHFGSVAQITSITPDPGNALRVGDKVRLQVEVSHVITGDTGTVTLLVLAEDSSSIAHDVRMVKKGSGKTMMQAEFTVPRTSVIRVYTPLTILGKDATAPADGRAFTVTAN